MNLIFCIMMISATAAMLFTAPGDALPAMIAGGSNAFLLTVKLLAIYAVWLSVLKMIERLSLDKKLAKAFSPLISRLFKGESDKAKEYITLNLTSNMLGMGGAATPAGIKAMGEMSDKTTTASHNMILLLCLNATSVQLIPATIIALRAEAGSASAADILLPSLIATACSTIIAVVLCKVMAKTDKGESTKTQKHSFKMSKVDNKASNLAKIKEIRKTSKNKIPRKSSNKNTNSAPETKALNHTSSVPKIATDGEK